MTKTSFITTVVIGCALFVLCLASVMQAAEVTPVWAVRYEGLGSGNPDADDEANAIAVDDLGNVYVTGESEGSGTYSDYATVKYDADGGQLWAARHNGPGNGYDWATDIAVDAAGHIHVPGLVPDVVHGGK